MKTTILKSVSVMFVLIVTALSVRAQSPVPDDLKGVWVYTHYRVGNQTFQRDFPSLKIYGDDGEYCCATVGTLYNGALVIVPHAYGTYVYRNNEYTECGRKGDLHLTSPTTFHGEWMGRIEHWKKVEDFPVELREYVKQQCRRTMLGDPEELQPLIMEHIIKNSSYNP